MFCGEWICTSVTGYVRRLTGGDKWTHWQITLQRGRYADEPWVKVDTFINVARKKKRGGMTCSRSKVCQIHHSLTLAWLHEEGRKDAEKRLKTIDHGFDPDKAEVKKELEAALLAFIKWHRKLKQKFIDLPELERCIKKACLKSE